METCEESEVYNLRDSLHKIMFKGDCWIVISIYPPGIERKGDKRGTV